MKEGTYWLVTSELPQEVFAVWHKPAITRNPVAIVATVDPDGAPRTAPVDNLRAITPKLLRLISSHHHNTFTNLSHDGRVMVALVAPPNMAVSVRGRARIVRERMNIDQQFAMVEIDIEEVKNDMVRSVIIESAITVLACTNEHKKLLQASLAEIVHENNTQQELAIIKSDMNQLANRTLILLSFKNTNTQNLRFLLKLLGIRNRDEKQKFLQEIFRLIRQGIVYIPKGLPQLVEQGFRFNIDDLSEIDNIDLCLLCSYDNLIQEIQKEIKNMISSE